jgi:hypothetical protein
MHVLAVENLSRARVASIAEHNNAIAVQPLLDTNHINLLYFSSGSKINAINNTSWLQNIKPVTLQ